MIADTGYEAEAIARVVPINLDSERAYNVLAVEDALLASTLTGNTGIPKDLADVAFILVTEPEMDEGYLSEWLDNFSLTLRFNQIRHDVILTRKDWWE